MNKIRILYIVGSSSIGGAEKIVYSLSKYLDKNKFEVYIACPKGPMVNDFKSCAKELRTFNFKIWFFNPLSVLSLSKYMRQKKIDIVHTHLYSADFMGFIAATLAGVPYKIATIHGYNFSTVGQPGIRRLKNYLFSLIYRAIYKYYNKVIAVCQAVKVDLIKRRGIRINPEQITVIYNSIDTKEKGGLNEAAVINSEYSFNIGNRRVVGTIANFDGVKGHHILLKSIPEVIKEDRNIVFLFVGDGEKKYKIKSLSEKLKIRENIIFAGRQRNIRHFFDLCDLIVQPSLQEGLPLVILEAMVLEKAIVATCVGGVPEVIENGNTGILVSPDNHRQLAESIAYVLKNKELASAMGINAKKIVLENFCLEKMLEKTEFVYTRLIKQSPDTAKIGKS